MAWTVHLNGHSTPAALTEHEEAQVRVNWLYKAIGKSLRIDPVAAAIYLEEPLSRPVEGKITNPFMGPGYPGNPWGKHLGIDIPALTGTPVWAISAGRVAWAGPWRELGNVVVLEHGSNYLSIYAHLVDGLLVSSSAVDETLAVGFVGSTGESTGPHLHLETWALSEPLPPEGDPYSWTRGNPGARPFNPPILWTTQRWPSWSEAEPRP